MQQIDPWRVETVYRRSNRGSTGTDDEFVVVKEARVTLLSLIQTVLFFGSMLVARWFLRISIPGNSVRCARCFQSGVSPLRKNGSPQMLKLGNASARTTAMRADASSSCARRAALIPASLPPIIRRYKGISLWFRFSALLSFEASRRFERLAPFPHSSCSGSSSQLRSEVYTGSVGTKNGCVATL
jgi:hypothetical protein